MHIEPHMAFKSGLPASIPADLGEEFPFLAEARVDHAIGETWARRAIDPATRQLATVAVFAAAGNRAQLKIHASYALNAGADQDALKEIVYLTAVHAGPARAIDAAQALSELFAERWETGRSIN
jgi:4-carboxymuconolactone decarboxylase